MYWEIVDRSSLRKLSPLAPTILYNRLGNRETQFANFIYVFASIVYGLDLVNSKYNPTKISRISPTQLHIWPRNIYWFCSMDCSHILFGADALQRAQKRKQRRSSAIKSLRQMFQQPFARLSARFRQRERTPERRVRTRRRQGEGARQTGFFKRTWKEEQDQSQQQVTKTTGVGRGWPRSRSAPQGVERRRSPQVEGDSQGQETAGRGKREHQVGVEEEENDVGTNVKAGELNSNSTCSWTPYYLLPLGEIDDPSFYVKIYQ